MRFQYRPLPAIWPSGERTREGARQSPRFRADWTRTMADLAKEVRMIAEYGYSGPIVVEAGFTEADIRLDGMPRAGARPLDPAVVVNFESRYGPLRYGCDTYTTWTGNLRAIALALDALRAVDRYGVSLLTSYSWGGRAGG